MVKVRIFILLNLVLLLSCGTSGEPLNLSNNPNPVEDSKAIVVRGEWEGINVITTVDKRTVRYLGEIENKGTQTACFIDITFSTKGADGKSVDQQQAVTRFMNGFTLTNFGEEIHSCLKPGDVGSFDTRDIPLAGEFADFDFSICVGRDGVCKNFPLAKDPRVPVELIILDRGSNNAGMRTVRARIKSNATDSNTVAYNIKAHLTVVNHQGRIVDTVLSDALTTGVSCGAFNITTAENSEGCLTVNATQDFTLTTHVPDSEVCDGCSYFRIYRSECVLVGNSCPQ